MHSKNEHFSPNFLSLQIFQPINVERRPRAFNLDLPVVNNCFTDINVGTIQV